MKLGPRIPPETIRRRLELAALELYGPERTGELADQILHLSQVLATVASHELDLRDEPLPGPSAGDRSAL